MGGWVACSVPGWRFVGGSRFLLASLPRLDGRGENAWRREMASPGKGAGKQLARCARDFFVVAGEPSVGRRPIV